MSPEFYERCGQLSVLPMFSAKELLVLRRMPVPHFPLPSLLACHAKLWLERRSSQGPTTTRQNILQLVVIVGRDVLKLLANTQKRGFTYWFSLSLSDFNNTNMTGDQIPNSCLVSCCTSRNLTPKQDGGALHLS